MICKKFNPKLILCLNRKVNIDFNLHKQSNEVSNLTLNVKCSFTHYVREKKIRSDLVIAENVTACWKRR